MSQVTTIWWHGIYKGCKKLEKVENLTDHEAEW